MKSLIVFLRYLLEESGRWCHVSTANDYKYIVGRVKEEGLSFLTISLPAYAKDLEKGLEQGKVDSSFFEGFSHKGVIPRFLGGMLSLIFDPSDGSLLDEPSTDAIRAIRQITLMFAKINLECTEERIKAAFAAFVKCEQDVRSTDRAIENGSLSYKEDFIRVSTLLFGDVFTQLDHMVYAGRYGDPKGHLRLLPKHGSGSTAEKLLGNKKYSQLEWTSRLEEIFPFGENVSSSWSSFLEVSNQLNILEPGAERPVRVIAVPKTQKTPRMIAIEPTCMQYMQQALLEAITDCVDRDDILTHFISTRSQEPNQRLAQAGSLDGELATLDLSEASDRVSYQQVRWLLSNHPNLMAGVDACRSRKADVLGHGVIRLAKFASMGSALCFPFEAMVFLTCVFMGIEDGLNRPLERRDLISFRGKVRVYGDDIIVPTRCVSSVIANLHLYGAKVNQRKSFWNGKFRESCGKEYYDGVDVSITRVRTFLPSSRKNAEEIISTVSLRNQLFDRGYDTTVQYLDQLLEGFIPFPFVGRESPVLGRYSHDGHINVDKWDSVLQRPLVKGVVVHAKLPRNSADGWPALTKYFLTRGRDSIRGAAETRDLPVSDREHLLYSGRPVSVDIKTRLASSV